MTEEKKKSNLKSHLLTGGGAVAGGLAGGLAGAGAGVHAWNQAHGQDFLNAVMSDNFSRISQHQSDMRKSMGRGAIGGLALGALGGGALLHHLANRKKNKNKMQKSAFWSGFEKQAGLISSTVRAVGGLGKTMATKGLDMATKPGGGALSEYAGKALHHTGDLIRKNPRLAAGIGGATALTAGGLGAKKLFGSNEK